MASRMTAKTFVGMEIRRAREKRKLSRANLAETVLVSESLVAAWETGRQAIKPEYIRELTKVLDFDQALIERIVTDLMNGEALPEWEGKWLAAEKEASSLWSFEIFVVSGLLQTPEYMGAVLSGEHNVNERLERQEILNGSTQLVAVMSEAVLRLNVGGPAVMASQLEYLAERATQENVIVQVVPMDSEICSKFRNPFMLATLDDGREVAYADSAISGEVIEQPTETAMLRKIYDRYRSDALRQGESVNLIRRMAEQWKA
ncbi:helix-turn-helix domain-containing protein [Spirillospora sp. CA-108201]